MTDIVYEDTGEQAKEDDIAYATVLDGYFKKLKLKNSVKEIKSEDVDGEPGEKVHVLKGFVKDILELFDEIGENDFFSEEPVAMFFHYPI